MLPVEYERCIEGHGESVCRDMMQTLALEPAWMPACEDRWDGKKHAAARMEEVESAKGRVAADFQRKLEALGKRGAS